MNPHNSPTRASLTSRRGLPAWTLALAVGVVSLLPLGQVAGQFPPVTLVDGGPLSGRLYVASPEVRGVGRSVADAGDVNADGAPELLVGAPAEQESLPGRVFVVPAPQGFSYMRMLAPGHFGITEIRSGSPLPDLLGSFVAGAGDVDGDGTEDFLVGMTGNAGPPFGGPGVFLVFGAERLEERIVLAERIGSEGRRAVFFALGGEGTPGGLTASGAGDLNGDGFDDLLVGLRSHGAQGGDPGRGSGKVWIIFGGAGVRDGPGVRPLGGLAPPQALVIAGAGDGDELGACVRGVGDIDGDGFDDAAVGAPGYGPGGAVFLLLGHAPFSEAPDLASPDGLQVVRLEASEPGSELGEVVDGGRDATGDGLPDLLLGAPGVRRDDARAGAAYLVAAGPSIQGVPVQPVPAPGGVILRGLPGSGTASAASFVPDMDEDGMAEVLVGAPGRRSDRGALYIVRGGREPGSDIVLEDLAPPDGWVFLADAPGVRLGASLVGLEDRSGNGRGDLAVGAPGLGKHGMEGTGAVFEIFFPEDPDSPAPKNLSATLLSGRRVFLSWMISTAYRFLRVYRDGVPVSPRLPGRELRFTDVNPGPGRHVYFVEADGNEDLRSSSVEIDVRPLAVGSLWCRQVEGGLTVIVKWEAGDVYEALQVFVDSAPATGVLPPDTQRVELELRPGDHLIEVYDPLSAPEGDRASCTVHVVAPELPAIQDLTCVAAGPRAVQLAWQQEDAYDAYLVLRDGFLLGMAEAGEYLDEGVPPGTVQYAVRGLNANLHPGPPAACELDVSESGDTFVRGRVAWLGGGPLRTGSVRVLAADGSELSRVQLSSTGEFRAGVPVAGSYAIVYEARIDASGLLPEDDPEPLMLSVPGVALTEDDTLLAVPPPIVLLVSRGPRTDEASVASRWAPLRAAIQDRAIALPVVVGGGIARAVPDLEHVLENARDLLAERAGSPPPIWDIVAHGAAGLAARAFLAGSPEPAVRKLVLLGTPNLGTARASVEARAEAFARPPRGLDCGCGGPGGGRGGDETPRPFSGALEQTPEFTSLFNAQVRTTRSADVHLVAGTGGRRVLDPVLGCDVHDDRVCADSALGGVPGAATHTVDEDHESLGRGFASVTLLVDEILALSSAAEDAGAAEPAGGGGGIEVDLAGAGADFEPSYSTSNTYIGVLEPGGTGDLPLLSDTSESMIIILNSDLPGGIRLRVQTPSGDVLEPSDAGALPSFDYATYGDGEGHDIQVFHFAPSEVGTYVALLENPETELAVGYTLEGYVAGDFSLTVEMNPPEVPQDEGTTVMATLTRAGEPETGQTVEASVLRPDGDLVLLDLADDGVGADAAAGDGIYSAGIPASEQPGMHQVVVSVSALDGGPVTYDREATAWYGVLSQAAVFTGDFTSSMEDSGADGVLDNLSIDVGVESTVSGLFLATGELTDLDGNPVASANAVFNLEGTETTSFRLVFSASDIFAARRNGPFVLSEVRLLDGSAGFVPADVLHDAYTTESVEWAAFGLTLGASYVRADTNEDGQVDISDGVNVLRYLFLGNVTLGCLAAADSNDDARIDIADAVYIFHYLFSGGQPPAAPYPLCGTGGQLGCESHGACTQ